MYTRAPTRGQRALALRIGAVVTAPAAGAGGLGAGLGHAPAAGGRVCGQGREGVGRG